MTQETSTASLHPWAIEDEQLLEQCIQYDPWRSEFFSQHQKKTRKMSDLGLFVAMCLCMASAMLRLKAR